MRRLSRAARSCRDHGAGSGLALAAGVALLAVLGGCGARSDLRGPSDDSAQAAPTCTLALGLPASRVFPEIEEDSASLFASFAATKEGDQACFLSFLRSQVAGTNALHARCMKAWNDLDRGPNVVIGPVMDDQGSIPPAFLSIATSASSGYALVYGKGLDFAVAPAMAPGASSLPTLPLTDVLRPLALGPPGPEGNLLLYVDPPAKRLAATHLHADGSLDAETSLFCASPLPRLTRVVRTGGRDLVAVVAGGGAPPACAGGDFGTVDVASIGKDVASGSIAVEGTVLHLALTSFGSEQAWMVIASSTAEGAIVQAVLLDSRGRELYRVDLGPYEGGFGVAAAALGGQLMVITDTPRFIGDMGSSAGLTARLVDVGGNVRSRLDIPLDVPLIDSPEPPAIVVSGEGRAALLGFFTQPTGTGGRDYLARVECVDP